MSQTIEKNTKICYNFFRLNNEKKNHMLSQLEHSIFKELDRQNFKADVISWVMENLNTDEKK